MLKLFIGGTLLIILTTLPETTRASGCVTKFTLSDSRHAPRLSVRTSGVSLWSERTEDLTCQDLRVYKLGLKAVSFSFTTIGAGLACTGAGTPVSVVMFGTGFVLGAADLFLESLDCVDDTPKAQEAAVREEVCQILLEQGIGCNSKEIVRK